MAVSFPRLEVVGPMAAEGSNRSCLLVSLLPLPLPQGLVLCLAQGQPVRMLLLPGLGGGLVEEVAWAGGTWRSHDQAAIFHMICRWGDIMISVQIWILN